MHEFGVSLRLWITIFTVSRTKQSIHKGFRSIEPDLESFELWLENWIWKVKKKIMGCKRIDTYFTTQGIHVEIRNHELTTQGNPPNRKENKRYTSLPKEST